MKLLRHIRAGLLLAGLSGCQGYVASDRPLLAPQDAEFPLRSGVAINGWTLGDDKVWQTGEHPVSLVVVNGSYRIVEPGRPAPDPDSFLVKRIAQDEFVVQATNGNEWAYGLLVRADMYYGFTFNHADANCTRLSAREREQTHIILRDDICYVTNQPDLIAVLRYLRRKFPYPTSAFKIADPS